MPRHDNQPPTAHAGACHHASASAGGTLGDRGRIAAERTVDGSSAPPPCPHCGGQAIQRWGKTDAGRSRRRCRSCTRTFSARTGTPLAGLRLTREFAAVLDDMVAEAPRSCRRLARALAIDKMTVWNWRRKISTSLLDPAPVSAAPAVDLRREPTRESRKGSREWAAHRRDPGGCPAPDRPRWLDVDRGTLPLPRPLSHHQLRVRVTATRRGCRPVVLPRACATSAPCRHVGTGALDDRASAFHSITAPCVRATLLNEAALGVWLPAADGSTLTACHAQRTGLQPPTPWQCPGRARSGGAECPSTAAPSAAGRTATAEVLRRLGAATLGALDEAFTGFLRPFTGPAAKYLAAYAAWFIARVDDSGDSRLRCLRSLVPT